MLKFLNQVTYQKNCKNYKCHQYIEDIMLKYNFGIIMFQYPVYCTKFFSSIIIL